MKKNRKKEKDEPKSEFGELTLLSEMISFYMLTSFKENFVPLLFSI